MNENTWTLHCIKKLTEIIEIYLPQNKSKVYVKEENSLYIINYICNLLTNYYYFKFISSNNKDMYMFITQTIGHIHYVCFFSYLMTDYQTSKLLKSPWIQITTKIYRNTLKSFPYIFPIIINYCLKPPPRQQSYITSINSKENKNTWVALLISMRRHPSCFPIPGIFQPAGIPHSLLCC